MSNVHSTSDSDCIAKGTGYELENKLRLGKLTKVWMSQQPPVTLTHNFAQAGQTLDNICPERSEAGCTGGLKTVNI